MLHPDPNHLNPRQAIIEAILAGRAVALIGHADDFVVRLWLLMQSPALYTCWHLRS